MYKTIQNNWYSAFISELSETEKIQLISPFINLVMVNHLLNHKEPEADVKLITRFCLSDFASGVSSLAGLKQLVESGALIKGIRGLHSKVYLFDEKSVILTSANFTSGGFFNNHEFGVISTDLPIIEQSQTYFNDLFNTGGDLLTLDKIKQWEQEIDQAKANRPVQPKLPDYGQRSIPIMNSPRKYFIKFFGSDFDRADPSYTVKDMITDSHCHYALTFSGKKGRPRKYNDNDIVFLARIMEGREYALFGYATTYRHVDERDVASPEDIQQIWWRADWPVYVRIHSPVFIDGTMGECPKMSDLISQLGPECFDKTQIRFQLTQDTSINPWSSLIRQADVQLSDRGAEWAANEINQVINRLGVVDANTIARLYKPDIVF